MSTTIPPPGAFAWFAQQGTLRSHVSYWRARMMNDAICARVTG